jgi:hypothetical protein
MVRITPARNGFRRRAGARENHIEGVAMGLLLWFCLCVLMLIWPIWIHTPW